MEQEERKPGGLLEGQTKLNGLLIVLLASIVAEESATTAAVLDGLVELLKVYPELAPDIDLSFSGVAVGSGNGEVN